MKNQMKIAIAMLCLTCSEVNGAVVSPLTQTESPVVEVKEETPAKAYFPVEQWEWGKANFSGEEWFKVLAGTLVDAGKMRVEGPAWAVDRFARVTRRAPVKEEERKTVNRPTLRGPRHFGKVNRSTR